MKIIALETRNRLGYFDGVILNGMKDT